MMECEWCLVNLALLDGAPGCLQVKEINNHGEETVWTVCSYKCLREMIA